MRRISLFAMVVVLGAACIPFPRGESDSPTASRGSPDTRVLVMAVRYEPTDLAAKMSTQAGAEFLKRPFNATLAFIDGTGEPRPYLAETLPQLNTDGWRVFPDGRMETAHRLRPNLTWQDGKPLTAEDFVFGWRVYRTPGLGVFSPAPQDKMDEVVAADPLTLVVRWNSPYPDASALTESRDGSLEPLPRHLLEQPFAEVLQDPTAKDRFFNLAYWTSEYVGAGPYRLESWEPGYQLSGVAFDGYVFGRPKIGRIVMRVMADENAVLATLLAGGVVDLATRFTLRFEHALVLKREWEAAGKGRVLMGSVNAGGHPMIFQFRPEFLKTPELRDLRVRKALAHTVNRQAIVDGFYEGIGEYPDTFVSRGEPYYSELDRALTKYPYDPRRTEQYLEEAGLTKDREGFFASRTGERFTPDYQTLAGTVFERGQAIIAETWRRAGISAQTSVLPAAQVRDLEARHTFPGIGTLGTMAADLFPSGEIGTPEKRWAGQNRGGWSNPEYDRLWEAYKSSLDRTERYRHMIQMMKLVSDEVPAFPLYYNIEPTFAHTVALRGPDLGATGTSGFWNLHEWELR